MKKEEKLREEYEDAYLALLMSEVAKAKGAKLLKENEWLKADPDFEVPESVTKRSMATIRREFARQTGKKTVRFAGKIFTRVACVAVLAALMLVTAYATIPSFRVSAQNFIMESTDIKTRLTLTEQEKAAEEERIVLLGYQIPEMPEGFELEKCWESPERAWIRYVNCEGRIIKIHLSHDIKHTIAIDTEDANSEAIEIQGYEGLLSIEMKTIQITWNDPDHDMFLLVHAEGIEQESVEEIANGVIWLEK